MIGSWCPLRTVLSRTRAEASVTDASREVLMLILSAVAMLLAASPAAPSVKAGLHVIKSIPLGGEGGWDYLTLDSETRRLYITRGDHVTVLDIDTDKVVIAAGDVQEIGRAHV